MTLKASPMMVFVKAVHRKRKNYRTGGGEDAPNYICMNGSWGGCKRSYIPHRQESINQLHSLKRDLIH